MPVVQFDKESVLAGHFLLRHLRREELRRLAATATLANYPRHATIFKKGDPGSSMMAVIRGRVKVCVYSADGKEVSLNLIDRGGLFGEIALLDGRPRTADAVTLEETDLLVLDRSRLLPFLTANPEVMIRLFDVLCQRLRQTSEHLEDVVLREAPARVARGLLRLSEALGKKASDGVRIDIRLSQQQIGSLIGISRESVNKQLGDWTRAGHLSVQSGILTIHDRSALEEIAEAEA